MGFWKKQIEKPYFLVLLFILILGFFLRWTTLVKYGINLTISSDDLGYQRSALQLLKSGMLTYHSPDKPTVYIMPGQPFLLAAIFSIFHSGKLGLLAAKLTMISFGIGSIYMTFRIGKYILNPLAGLISALILAVYIPEILIENLTLTESPYLFFFLGLIYWSLKLADTHSMKDFFVVLLFYFLSLFFRVQIALYPILLFIYLIVKRYPFKVMGKQLFISIIALLIVLGPWWVRNYLEFHQFIPLTAGSGDPLLLGTYQGVGYPPGNSNTDQVYSQILKEHPGIEVHKAMEIEQQMAISRMKEWWKTDKMSMIKSYLVLKPQLFWQSQFYWTPILHVSQDVMQSIFIYFKKLFYICCLIVLVLSFKKWKEYGLLWINVLFQTYFSCLYYAYNRYALPLMPILFIITGIGITLCLISLKNLWKRKVSAKGKE